MTYSGSCIESFNNGPLRVLFPVMKYPQEQVSLPDPDEIPSLASERVLQGEPPSLTWLKCPLLFHSVGPLFGNWINIPATLGALQDWCTQSYKHARTNCNEQNSLRLWRVNMCCDRARGWRRLYLKLNTTRARMMNWIAAQPRSCEVREDHAWCAAIIRWKASEVLFSLLILAILKVFCSVEAVLRDDACGLGLCIQYIM